MAILQSDSLKHPDASLLATVDVASVVQKSIVAPNGPLKNDSQCPEPGRTISAERSASSDDDDSERKEDEFLACKSSMIPGAFIVLTFRVTDIGQTLKRKK